ncbi:protein adenylyltransferase SelO family protein [Henriciella litoralis]|uniref:protein adenylyltransferase SelO family protein n=1 Tax=Henriciella litoralis TaxID=568102 RepID=UPI000A02D91D|nr:YdiU family protein [Henriciella litoralis]
MIYSAAPEFLPLADAFADAASPAHFRMAVLRFRNTRWASRVGLEKLGDEAWLNSFARFEPLSENLPHPLAMRYHGHQFGVYNPELGDGRGFLFAQLRDDTGRVLDLGTKGSGQTRWSRSGDGRLTLKGGVREVLAAQYLEAHGVKTSKPFSLVETGDELQRNDEPSPTRSAVLVRLSHSHIRFGTFQRSAYLGETENLARLIRHCAETYYPETLDTDITVMAPALLERITGETARMIAQWMATGFVHGVMNTDNFNITGESFDYGPWRFLPHSDPNFTAAYFDQQGLYRFGRQPTQGLWALQQLASTFTLVCDADPLTAALETYETAYQHALADHNLKLFGLKSAGGLKSDLIFLQSLYNWMSETQVPWAQVFFDWFCGTKSAERAARSPIASQYETPGFAPVREALEARTPDRPERLIHAYWQRETPVTLLVDDVEGLWDPIADKDDWSVFEHTLADIEAARQALDIPFEAPPKEA